MDATHSFESADDLFTLMKEQGPKADIVIMAAAVSDAKPAERHHGKVKKADQEWSLSLAPTPDILAWLGEHKSDGQRLIGFAMESDAETAQEAALTKMKTKKLDAIILNLLRDGESGFGIDTNKVELFVAQKSDAGLQDQAENPPFAFTGTKLDVALQLIDQLEVSLARVSHSSDGASTNEG